MATARPRATNPSADDGGDVDPFFSTLESVMQISCRLRRRPRRHVPRATWRLRLRLRHCEAGREFTGRPSSRRRPPRRCRRRDRENEEWRREGQCRRRRGRRRLRQEAPAATADDRPRIPPPRRFAPPVFGPGATHRVGGGVRGVRGRGRVRPGGVAVDGCAGPLARPPPLRDDGGGGDARFVFRYRI